MFDVTYLCYVYISAPHFILNALTNVSMFTNLELHLHYVSISPSACQQLRRYLFLTPFTWVKPNKCYSLLIYCLISVSILVVVCWTSCFCSLFRTCMLCNDSLCCFSNHYSRVWNSLWNDNKSGSLTFLNSRLKIPVILNLS